jgi:hypothetical protein
MPREKLSWLQHAALQSRVHRFDSGRRLDVEGHTSKLLAPWR